MLRIRLQRTGKKNEPHYRLVLTEKTSPTKSKALEILGSYNPRSKEKNFKKDRVLHWISVGAQVSDTAFNLLHSENILEGQKIVKKKLSKRKRDEEKKKLAEEAEAKAKEIAEEKEKKETAKEEATKEEPKEEEEKKEETTNEDKKSE